MPMKDRERLIAHQRLFGKNLPHMRHIVHRKAASFGIGKFVVVLPKCLGCGVSISAARSAGSESAPQICRHCNYTDVVDRFETKKKECEQKSQAAWDICRKCQGGGFGKVTCSNLDCGNFFHRERMLMDIEDVEKDLQKLCRGHSPSAPAPGAGADGPFRRGHIQI